MKLSNTNASPVETNITNQSSSFSIKSSPKAFQILTDKLYSDKISAIIRELSCNAYDSHVAANKADEPFTVHLPLLLEPWFSVKDTGVGLSHDEVVNVFTTFFESTKSDSNEYVGALGLGSKSPFAYVDSYTVTSTKDGMVNNYTCFKSEEGTPQVLLIDSKKTKEPNGLTIHVPVKHNDIQEFNDKAVQVYLYFKTIPNMSASILNKIKVLKTSMEDDYVRMGCSVPSKYIATDAYYSFNEVSWTNAIVAVMGNVAYPVNPALINRDINKLLCNLTLFFDIGELDVSPSRETLSYDKSTIAVLQNAIDLANKNIRIKSLIHIRYDTKWEGLIKYNEESNRYGDVIRENKLKSIYYLDALGINWLSVRKEYSYIPFKKDENVLMVNSLSTKGIKHGRDYQFMACSKIVFFEDDTDLSKTKIDKSIQYIQRYYSNMYDLIVVFTNKKSKYKLGKYNSLVNKLIRDYGFPKVASLAKLMEDNLAILGSQITPTIVPIKRIPICYYHDTGSMRSYDGSISTTMFSNAKEYLWQILKSNEYLDDAGQPISRIKARQLADIAKNIFNKEVPIIPITYIKELQSPKYLWGTMRVEASRLLQDAKFIREWVLYENMFINLQHCNVSELENVISDIEVTNFLRSSNINSNRINTQYKIALINFFNLTKPPSYGTLKLEMAALNKKAEKYHLLTQLDTAYVAQLSSTAKYKLIDYLES